MGRYPLNTSETVSTFVELLCQRAAETTDRLAYSFIPGGRSEEVHFTYGSLELRARAIAAELQALGAAGERAILLYTSGLDYIAGFFGCLFAGVIGVPAYPPMNEHQAERIWAILRDTGATVALTQNSVLSEGKLQALGLQGAGLEDEGWGSRNKPVKVLVTDLVPDEMGGSWRNPGAGPDDLAFLQYTSGSTASPKGVMLSHGNLLHNCSSIHSFFGLSPEGCGVSWLPLFHDMGLIGMILTPLYCCGPSTLMAPMTFLKRPDAWLEAISRKPETVTFSGGPNFAFDLCVQKIQPEQIETLNLANWRVAFVGAEPVRAQTLESFARTFAPAGFRMEAFYPCYGLAEGTLIVSGGNHSTPPIVRSFSADGFRQNKAIPMGEAQQGARQLVGCGRPAPSQTLAIVDPETLSRCSEGEIGEICVSGPSVTRGYWERPEESREACQVRIEGSFGGPFLRTGDLGFILEGELFVIGRFKDLIIIRGKNYHPEDIEMTIGAGTPYSSPRAAVAFSIEVEAEERLVLALETPTKTGQKEKERDIQTIRESVTETNEVEIYSVLLVKAGSLPKTPSGKIQRRACREKYLNGELPIVAQWISKPADLPTGDERSSVEAAAHEPSGDVSALRDRYESLLVSWVARHAKLAENAVDVNASFARYNLGSVDAVRLTGELENRLGRRVSPTVFYDYPTIESLSNYLAGLPIPLTVRSEPRESRAHSSEIAVVGLACRF